MPKSDTGGKPAGRAGRGAGPAGTGVDGVVLPPGYGVSIGGRPPGAGWASAMAPASSESASRASTRSDDRDVGRITPPCSDLAGLRRSVLSAAPFNRVPKVYRMGPRVRKVAGSPSGRWSFVTRAEMCYTSSVVPVCPWPATAAARAPGASLAPARSLGRHDLDPVRRPRGPQPAGGRRWFQEVLYGPVATHRL